VDGEDPQLHTIMEINKKRSDTSPKLPNLMCEDSPVHIMAFT